MKNNYYFIVSQTLKAKHTSFSDREGLKQQSEIILMHIINNQALPLTEFSSLLSWDGANKLTA